MKAWLPILFPSIVCPETGYVLLIISVMVARTFCDLWVIQNSTKIEASIIAKNLHGFITNLRYFLLAMGPLAGINALLKLGIQQLTVRFRSRMTHYFYEKYLKGFVYYRISNLDTRISNVDQLLTTDVERFCNSVTHMLSNISKPLLDIVIYSIRLSSAIGIEGPLAMLGYLAVSGVLLTKFRRPLGRFTVKEQKLEGEYRYVNSRLITNAEEVAFLSW